MGSPDYTSNGRRVSGSPISDLELLQQIAGHYSSSRFAEWRREFKELREYVVDEDLQRLRARKGPVPSDMAALISLDRPALKMAEWVSRPDETIGPSRGRDRASRTVEIILETAEMKAHLGPRGDADAQLEVMSASGEAQDEPSDVDVGRQRLDAGTVVALPRQQDKANEITQRIGQGDDLGRHSAARTTDRLISSLPFAPVPGW